MNHHSYDLNIHSSCRTCLENVNGTHYDIFTTPDLQKKITVCTSLSVEPDDGFPASLCELCHTKIEDFYNFQLICISALQRFQEYINLEKKPCTLELAIDTNNIQTEIMVFNEAKTELEEVDYTSNEECSGFGHEKLSNVKTENKSSLEDEGEESNGGEPILKYYKSDEDNSYIDNSNNIECFPKNKKRKTKIKFECKICNICFKKSETLERHMREHQGLKPFPCQECDKAYARRNRLKNHIKDKHEGTFPCTESGCDMIMACKQTLRQHIKDIHWSKSIKPKEDYICEECGKVLTSLASLRNHIYLHTGMELPHECPQCQKRFTTKNKLKDHMNRHAGIRNYTCPDCGAKKATRTELNKHITSHIKEKTLPCEFCDMMFNSVWNLTRHKRVVHEGIKKYPCSYCDKSFGKSDTRKHHEMTHTGEKPHECNICHRKFIQYVALKKHEMIHQKPRRGKKRTDND